MKHESVENVGEKNVAFSGGGGDEAALRVKSQATTHNTYTTARTGTHLQLRRAVAEGAVLLTRDVAQSQCLCTTAARATTLCRVRGSSDLRAGGDAVHGQMYLRRMLQKYSEGRDGSYVFGVAQTCVEAAGHVSERGVSDCNADIGATLMLPAEGAVMDTGQREQ